MTSRKLDPRHAAVLDSKERKEILPVEKIIEVLDLPEVANVADIGCGTGYLTIPLAQKVTQGQIFAVDIEPRMLSALKERAKGLKNITLIQSTEDRIPVAEGTVDISFLVAVLHELNNPEGYLKEIGRISKDRHYVIVVDWNEKEGAMGPPIKIRIPKDKTIGLFKIHDYKLVKEFVPSEYFYGLVFQCKR